MGASVRRRGSAGGGGCDIISFDPNRRKHQPRRRRETTEHTEYTEKRQKKSRIDIVWRSSWRIGFSFILPSCSVYSVFSWSLFCWHSVVTLFFPRPPRRLS